MEQRFITKVNYQCSKLQVNFIKQSIRRDHKNDKKKWKTFQIPMNNFVKRFIMVHFHRT